MPSLSAASRALARSREAIAAISDASPRCIAGITFSTAILATPSTPHLTFRNAASPFGLSPLAALCLWSRRSALRLARQHPAGVLGPQRADRIERRDLLGRERQLGGGEIVVELLDGLRPDDDAHDPLALQQPGERNPGDGRVVRPGDRRHRVDDVVGALLVDRREVERRPARVVVAFLVAGELARQEAAGERAPYHHAEALILDERDDLALELAAGDRVISLHRLEARPPPPLGDPQRPHDLPSGEIGAADRAHEPARHAVVERP